MAPTINDKFGKASIDTNYAIATTVKTTRTVGVTVLEAYDLSKYADDTPVFFVTYKKTTDPVTGITSVIDLVSWKGLVNTAANTLTNLEVAPGYTDIGNDMGDFIECIPTAYWENSLIDGLFVGHNPDGTFKKSALQSALGNDGQLVQALDEVTSDFVQSGGVWTQAAGLNGTMTALVAYIDGYRNTVATVASRAFTINKDTYVDVKRDTTTNAFSLVYTEVANGAASPALAANSVRLAKIVTNGTAITFIYQTGRDSLNNSIKPTGAISANNIDFSSFDARITDMYIDTFYTGNLSGVTQGNSYNYSGALPRALQSGESVMIIGRKLRWCTLEAADASSSTNFNYTLDCVVSTSLMAATFSFIYYRKGS